MDKRSEFPERREELQSESWKTAEPSNRWYLRTQLPYANVRNCLSQERHDLDWLRSAESLQLTTGTRNVSTGQAIGLKERRVHAILSISVSETYALRVDSGYLNTINVDARQDQLSKKMFLALNNCLECIYFRSINFYYGAFEMLWITCQYGYFWFWHW